jgi:hypothetical protein
VQSIIRGKFGPIFDYILGKCGIGVLEIRSEVGFESVGEFRFNGSVSEDA